jgi:hypothetical protein
LCRFAGLVELGSPFAFRKKVQGWRSDQGGDLTQMRLFVIFIGAMRGGIKKVLIFE